MKKTCNNCKYGLHSAFKTQEGECCNPENISNCLCVLIDSNDLACSKWEQIGVKFDVKKSRMDLLDPDTLMLMADVMGFGAEKYGDHNWRNGIDHSRLYSAAQRHLNQYWNGETFDEESDLNHLSHAMCNLMMMIATPFLDDRYKKENKNE